MPKFEDLQNLPQDHPLWQTIHAATVTVVLTACIGFLLAIFASNFDATEWATIGGSALAIGGREVVRVVSNGKV